jgi:hypothetical protein
VSMAKWATHSASPIARRCQVARSKTGSCEINAFHGLYRVGTTPIRSGACRRHIFLKFSKAGAAEVPGPCMYRVLSEEAEELHMATIALVDY